MKFCFKVRISKFTFELGWVVFQRQDWDKINFVKLKKNKKRKITRDDVFQFSSLQWKYFYLFSIFPYFIWKNVGKVGTITFRNFPNIIPRFSGQNISLCYFNLKFLVFLVERFNSIDTLLFWFLTRVRFPSTRLAHDGCF